MNPLSALSPTVFLAAISFFTGDIQGGLGPFLSAWLAAERHWAPEEIGWVTTAVGLAALLFNSPAGALADHSRRPRLLLAGACVAILLGTFLILPAQHPAGVLAAQLLAAAGGVLLLPTFTLLTLGVVGKDRFAGQQGRNQAWNHAGIVLAALAIWALGGHAGAAFWVLGGMAGAAIITVFAMPSGAFNGRRALGWHEGEPDDVHHRGALSEVLRNPMLIVLAVSLLLFNLGNGAMLSLLGQRIAYEGLPATQWTATYVIAAQLTMIPVALWAAGQVSRVGRRRVLMLAFLSLPVRAVITALVHAPLLLIPAEILDGLSSGIIGVLVPVVVADLTWGSGRTQTALGAVNTVQGIGGALSGLLAGMLTHWLGWQDAFLALAVPAAAAGGLALLLHDHKTAARVSVVSAEPPIESALTKS